MDNDYNDFLNSSEASSRKLDDDILKLVHLDLNPSNKIVFFKLTLIQAFIGCVTMFFCPQFNLSFTNNFDLFHYFHMNFGHEACMMICGCIFLGSGAIFASYILSQGEINKIKSSRFLYLTGLSTIAVACFIFIGAEIYLNMLFFWLAGAIGGSTFLFELNHFIRKTLTRI